MLFGELIKATTLITRNVNFFPSSHSLHMKVRSHSAPGTSIKNESGAHKKYIIMSKVKRGKKLS